MPKTENFKVLVTGRVDGEHVEYSANVDEFEIEVKDAHSVFPEELCVARDRNIYYFNLRLAPDVNGKAFTVKRKPERTETVSKRAEINIPAPTAKAIENARRAVGAPEGAHVSFMRDGWQPENSIKLTPERTLVFEWAEEVNV